MKSILRTAVFGLFVLPVLAQDFFTLYQPGWTQRLVRRTPITTYSGISGAGGASMAQDLEGHTYYQDQGCRIFKINPAGAESLFASAIWGSLRNCLGLSFSPGRRSVMVLIDVGAAQTDRAIIEIYPAPLDPAPPPTGVRPFGYVDIPLTNETFPRESTITVAGWALASEGIDRVNIYAVKAAGGNVLLGSAFLGIARPDVLVEFPDYSNSNAGFTFAISASSLMYIIAGSQPVYGTPITLYIRAYDAVGNMTELKRFKIYISAL